ncbi:hypothetical protein HQQ80_14835 [Microbacteriaceae bacterium VKM Ac-2855]|nr:hypothetical protein [Microbacteriaceae bacterium VKM Ac-2855]
MSPVRNRIGLITLTTGAAVLLAGCTFAAPDPAPTASASAAAVSCSPREATATPQEYISTESNYVLTRVDRSDASAPEGSVQVPLTGETTYLDDIIGAAVDDKATWTEGILASLIRQNYLPEGSGTDFASSSVSDVPDGTLLGNGGHEVNVEVVVTCDGEEYFSTRLHSSMPNNYGLSIGCPDTGPATTDSRVQPMRDELATYCG